MAAVEEQEEEEVTCEDEEPIPLHMMCQQVCMLPEDLYYNNDFFTCMYVLNASNV